MWHEGKDGVAVGLCQAARQWRRLDEQTPALVGEVEGIGWRGTRATAELKSGLYCSVFRALDGRGVSERVDEVYVAKDCGKGAGVRKE